MIDKFLKKHGFVSNKADHCFYTLIIDSNNYVFLLLYVDDIIVAHHFHEMFISDPTHKRPITVDGMMLFSKKFNREHIAKHGSSSGMGLKFNVDFEITWYDYDYDIFYESMIADYKYRRETGKTTKEEDFLVTRLMREANNVAIHTKIKLKVVKETNS